MSLEFTSELLRQIQRRFEARDDRGRPFIVSADAKQIADTSRTFVDSLVEWLKQEPNSSTRLADSPVLCPLIAKGSGRLLRHAVETFDQKHPERFLQADTIDGLIQTECQALLEENDARPDLAAAITSLIEFDKVAAATLKCATVDLLQCGCDRRTLLFVPNEVHADGAVVERLRVLRPLAAVVPANVDDVLVVSEEAGISPRSLALGLERVFPGIADAANRLLTH